VKHVRNRYGNIIYNNNDKTAYRKQKKYNRFLFSNQVQHQILRANSQMINKQLNIALETGATYLKRKRPQFDTDTPIRQV
jgi:hypothetical protein